MSGRCVIDDRVVECLAASGAPYALKPGKRHVRVVVGGRLAAVLPYGRKIRSMNRGRAADNALAAVRRAVRAWREGANPLMIKEE